VSQTLALDALMTAPKVLGDQVGSKRVWKRPVQNRSDLISLSERMNGHSDSRERYPQWTQMQHTPGSVFVGDVEDRPEATDEIRGRLEVHWSARLEDQRKRDERRLRCRHGLDEIDSIGMSSLRPIGRSSVRGAKVERLAEDRARTRENAGQLTR
jgi:hypothetical protein